MKAGVLVFVFFLLIALAVLTPHRGYAQQRGAMGIGIILKPIQTIQVDGRNYGGSTGSVGVLADHRTAYVTGFGTSMYGVSVDRITIDSLTILKNEVGGRSTPGSPATTVSLQRAPLENRKPANRDRPLLVYSIRVR